MTVDSPAAAPRTAAPKLVRILDAINQLLVLALAAALASFAVRNSDFWLHLAAGRLIAAGQYTFGVDPFSALAPAPTWINHAWLFDLLLFLAYRSAGAMAVVVGKAALVAVTAAVMLRIRRPAAGRWAPVLLTAVALLALAPRLLFQPAIVSFLFMAVLLLILTRTARTGPRWQRPLSIAILFALWVNLDGGFIFGLLLLATWLVGAALQYAVGGERGGWSPGELAVGLLAGLAGCLCNPHLHRALSLPSDFAFLAIPAELRGDELFLDLFRSPIEKSYATAVAGTIPAMAYFALVGLGLGSFGLNLRSLNWPRLMTWLVFAAVSLLLARLVPYFAVVAAPITVLNFQDFAARRAVAPVDARAAFAGAFIGGFGRFLTAVAGLGLLAIAWPGGFAPDAGTFEQSRRVSWEIVPDSTWVQAAEQLNAWHVSGAIPEGEGRGFFLQPTFGYFCAWAAPAEKMVFDPRLTNPDVAADYIGLRRELLALRTRGDAAPESGLRKLGITHLVLTGRLVLEQQLGRAILVRSDRFPLYGIAGRSITTGWRDAQSREAFPALRLDPVRLAASATPIPSPTRFPDPPATNGWERFRAAPRPVPAEAYESGLWMGAREAAQSRMANSLVAFNLASELGRSVQSDALHRVFDSTVVAQYMNGLAEQVVQRSADNRLARTAPLLAVRSARRAILVNPDNYDAYFRLVSGYLAFETDPELSFVQQITAARQALQRIPQATAYGQFAAPEALYLNGLLLQLYDKSSVIPTHNVRPIDLILECSEQILELQRTVLPERLQMIPPDQRADAQKGFEEEYKQKTAQLEAMRAAHRRASDNYENRAAKAPPVQRALIAAGHGLVREALTVLRGIDAQQLTRQDSEQMVELLIHLSLFAGEADQAHGILRMPNFHPVTVLPRELQPRFRAFNLQVGAALGDYSEAIESLDPAANAPMTAYAGGIGQVLQLYVLGDLNASPLSRVATLPVWGGLFPKEGMQQPGLMLQLRMALQQQADAAARQGILALEQGDTPLARRRLTQAFAVAGRMEFALRTVAARWFDLFRPPAN